MEVVGERYGDWDWEEDGEEGEWERGVLGEEGEMEEERERDMGIEPEGRWIWEGGRGIGTPIGADGWWFEGWPLEEVDGMGSGEEMLLEADVERRCVG